MLLVIYHRGFHNVEIIEELSYDLKKYGTREAGLLNSLQTLSCFALRTCSYRYLG